MPDAQRPARDLKGFVLPEIGQLLETEDRWEPVQLLDLFGRSIEPAAVYFKDLVTADCSLLTPRSYGMDLLRWWRFLLCTSQVEGLKHGSPTSDGKPLA
ncbi:hypothetical protein ABZT51_09305 [Streptomyces sp. NPDC005373]|uniref:hypothetical protein n=1 Tax=Streptomyces sp. NPDC005373 TaxID=3156879 RepID=UPI0033BE43DE